MIPAEMVPGVEVLNQDGRKGTVVVPNHLSEWWFWVIDEDTFKVEQWSIETCRVIDLSGNSEE